MTPLPAALLFDFGGTLDAEGVAWKTRFARLWRDEAGEVEPAVFDRAFYDADDALVGRIAPETTLSETVRLLTSGLARRLPWRDSGAAARIADRFCADAAARLAANAALLERLAQRHRLGVVSNFYGNLSAVCAEAGLAPHISVAVDSAAVGFQKPDVRIFQAALDALKAKPEDAVFVGDSPERDMAGARSAGLRHVLLADAGRSESPGTCCPDDRVIRRLRDLEEAIA
ncbi:MAG TPA: HAD family hydrolase [Thermoanaerobaculia bacterium]|nr:HAD family hydrolase [Thermoanaerobaculia bacterium]